MFSAPRVAHEAQLDIPVLLALLSSFDISVFLPSPLIDEQEAYRRCHSTEHPYRYRPEWRFCPVRRVHSEDLSACLIRMGK
jgi:hypothetical protein